MPWYSCFIRGENFPGEIWDDDEPYGFYTHRIVEAGTREEAEQKALEAMRRDDSFAIPDAAQAPELAKVFFEEIDELLEKPEKTDIRGATWFKMSEADFDED